MCCIEALLVAVSTELEYRTQKYENAEPQRQCADLQGVRTSYLKFSPFSGERK